MKCTEKPTPPTRPLFCVRRTLSCTLSNPARIKGADFGSDNVSFIGTGTEAAIVGTGGGVAAPKLAKRTFKA